MTRPNAISPQEDPDAPTTAALRRRLEIAGELPRPGQPTIRHYNCLLCGCRIGNDLDADRVLGACGTCRSRPEARRLQAISGITGARGFTEAETSLIRKTHGSILDRPTRHVWRHYANAERMEYVSARFRTDVQLHAGLAATA